MEFMLLENPWLEDNFQLVSRCIAMPTLTSLSLFVVAAFAVCIFARMRLPVCEHPAGNSAHLRMAHYYAQNFSFVMS